MLAQPSRQDRRSERPMRPQWEVSPLLLAIGAWSASPSAAVKSTAFLCPSRLLIPPYDLPNQRQGSSAVGVLQLAPKPVRATRDVYTPRRRVSPHSVRMAGGRTHEKSGSSSIGSSSSSSVGDQQFEPQQEGDKGQLADKDVDSMEAQERLMTETLSMLTRVVKTTIPPSRIQQRQSKQSDWKPVARLPDGAAVGAVTVRGQDGCSSSQRSPEHNGNASGETSTALQPLEKPAANGAPILPRLLRWSSRLLPWRGDKQSAFSNISSSDVQRRGNYTQVSGMSKPQRLVGMGETRTAARPPKPPFSRPVTLAPAFPAALPTTNSESSLEAGGDRMQSAAGMPTMRTAGWPWPWFNDGEDKNESKKVQKTTEPITRGALENGAAAPPSQPSESLPYFSSFDSFPAMPSLSAALPSTKVFAGVTGDQEQGEEEDSVSPSAIGNRQYVSQWGRDTERNSTGLGATASENPLAPRVSIPAEAASPRLPRMLAWVKDVAGMSLSTLGKPLRRSSAAVAAASPPPFATDAPATVGKNTPINQSASSSSSPVPPPSVVSPAWLNLPPAAQALKQRLAENPYFPVESTWRPPGYRRAVSLPTSRAERRAAAARLLEVKGGAIAQKEADETTVAAGGTPSIQGRPSSSVVNVDAAGVVKDDYDTLAKTEGTLRKMRTYLEAVPGVAGGLVNAIGRRLKKNLLEGRAERKREGGKGLAVPKIEKSAKLTDPQEDNLVAENRAGLKIRQVQRGDDVGADSVANDGDGGTLEWQGGAAIVLRVGLGLARSLGNLRLHALAADKGGESDVVTEKTPDYRELGRSNKVKLGSFEADEATQQQKEMVPVDITPLTPAQSVNKVDNKDQRRERGAGPLAAVAPLLDKAATTSRRAKLWLLLRRVSMARAEPLIPSVDSAISSLSVPLVSLDSAPPSAEVANKKDLGAEPGSADGVALAEEVSSETAAEAANKLATSDSDGVSEVSAPQAVGGGGWNLFGFFPTDKEETEEESSTTKLEADVRITGSSVPTGLEGSETATLDGDEERGEVIYWPLSAWVEGYDPRAQVEAAMREALRSAFGYGAVGGASSVAPETFAAAAAAAGDAAVAEATTANGTDGKSLSPTTRYLDDLSPSSGGDQDEDSRWRGAEAAALAAAEAAGAAAGAAGAAAGVAAEVAQAAAAATLAVAAEALPFGTDREDDMSTPRGAGTWQVSGRRRKGWDHDNDDDAGFGEGPLGIKSRKLDEAKTKDMVLDPLSSAGLKRSVARDSEVQKQRPGYVSMFSAAVSRYSRLPLPKWRRSREPVTTAATTHVNDAKDLQDITLRRLGKAGVVRIASSMLLISSEMAQQVETAEELEQFRAEGGMSRVFMAFSPTPYTTKASGIAAIRNLLRVSPESIAAEIIETAGVEALVELRRLVGAPGEPWSAAAAAAAAAATDSSDAMRLQAEAVQLLQELSLASEEAFDLVKKLPNLIPALSAIAHPSTGLLGRLRGRIGRSLGAVGGVAGRDRVDAARHAEALVAEAAVAGASKLLSMLGVHQWRPRQPGQRGLRILSLDGGGTRGVMSIALLREVLEGFDKDVYEVFDVICGTSTGGILAMLFTAEKQSLAAASALYDQLVVKIFRKDILGSANLVLRQAQYSSTDWEAILHDILEERRIIDTCADPDCPRVILCSTIINTIPLQMMLWRNYGYREDQEPVYKGDYRRKMRECVRATTAAPSYFTPLSDGDILYADGAFMANNPTSIALTEAKLLYPDVPIECVLSVGTGYYTPKLSDSGMGWPTVVNQLINSATDTENVDAMLKTFLPRDKYFRFNPSIEHFAIDEIRPEKLAELKTLAKEYVSSPEVQARAKELRRLLRGDETNFSWPGSGGGLSASTSSDDLLLSSDVEDSAERELLSTDDTAEDTEVTASSPNFGEER